MKLCSDWLLIFFFCILARKENENDLMIIIFGIKSRVLISIMVY